MIKDFSLFLPTLDELSEGQSTAAGIWFPLKRLAGGDDATIGDVFRVLFGKRFIPNYIPPREMLLRDEYFHDDGGERVAYIIHLGHWLQDLRMDELNGKLIKVREGGVLRFHYPENIEGSAPAVSTRFNISFNDQRYKYRKPQVIYENILFVNERWNPVDLNNLNTWHGIHDFLVTHKQKEDLLDMQIYFFIPLNKKNHGILNQLIEWWWFDE